MKFSEYKYEHLNEQEVLEKIRSFQKQLAEATSYEEFFQIFKEYDKYVRYLATMQELVGIRHTINTKDEFYAKENDFFDQFLPVLQDENVKIVKTIYKSPYLEQLKKDLPETYFKLKENEMKSFSPKIIGDMQEENKLASSYQNLIASADIEFAGNHYSLAGLEVHMLSQDRKEREAATKAYWGWYDEHQDEIGEIYDKMVKVRTRMAKKLGFENYIPLGYLRMLRLDYDQNDVANYRKQVLKDVVPFASELYERQRKRLGYDTLHVWDEKVEFKTGNPKPKYGREEMVKRALKMYKELDPETGKFFQFMVDHELLDLDSHPGKAAGGYCTFIPDYDSPFIFANFNQTNGDAEVLTHEAGHAFQVYSSKNIFPFDCIWPTLESCEIHSMSMEFFTYPWMKSFFEEDVDKYYYNHLGGAIKFLPYGVLVDHFQHEVYAHPEMSPKERMQTWRKLEKQYLPHKNYEGIDFLENGGWWMRQLHIFMDPFYYIDYTLAQECALQFWERLQKKDPQAFEDYKKICRAGGTLSFKNIVKTANLRVPFEDNCLKSTVEAVRNWFDHVDDSNY